MKIAVAYIATLVFFAALDFIWLGVVAKSFYQSALGHLMADKFNVATVLAFYFIYAAGVVYFAVLPALDAGSFSKAATLGLAFGFFAYATYDLTNQATMRDWPIAVTIADITWGALLTSATAAVGYAVGSRF